MTREGFTDLQRQLAAIDRQIAELHVKRAAIHDELAGAEASPRTGRRTQRPHLPTLPPVSSLDKARADQALQALDRKRSLRR